jgi:hypothetical protein
LLLNSFCGKLARLISGHLIANGAACPASSTDIWQRKCYYGYMCALWKKDNFWSQPSLVEEGHYPDFSSKPANDQRLRKRAQGSQGVVRQVHPHAGKDELIVHIDALIKIAAQAVIFCLTTQLSTRRTFVFQGGRGNDTRQPES